MSLKSDGSTIRKSMPSGYDPMGGYQFSLATNASRLRGDRAQINLEEAMLGRLNHVAIAVRDAQKAAKIYGAAFNAEISPAVPLPEHGVTTVFVTLPNTKIEFIEPLGDASPIAKFVERNADGGIHHVCYDVPDIIAARDRLIGEGARVLGDGQPKIGAHGKPVLFFHPKDFSGALVEIEQA
jgi:methylmalonyl-CoA/ethylmalonyl-CoA epimerase